MSLLRRVLLVLGLGAFLASNIHGFLTREEPLRPSAELLRSVSQDSPPSVRLEGRYGPYYSDAEDQGDRRASAVAFLTNQVDPEVKGYAGEISVLAGVDSSGTVTGVRLVDHDETPSYMRDVVESGFLERLAGRKLGADLAGVDAVTGATITSNAIREDVLRSGALVYQDEFGVAIEGLSPPPGFLSSLSAPRALAMLGAMGIAVAAFMWRSFRAGRAISLAAGLLVVGLYCNLPLSTAHFTNLVSLRIPSPSNAPLILLLVFVFATGLIFRSRVYCDYLCPFAAVQEAAYALSKRKTSVSDVVWRGSTILRHLLLFAIALVVAIGGYHAAAAMEPYVFLFNPGRDLLPWIYVGAVIIAALFVRRFWCRVFCPCGACVELVASVRGARKAKSGEAAAALPGKAGGPSAAAGGARTTGSGTGQAS